jgi:hypothetical protein
MLTVMTLGYTNPLAIQLALEHGCPEQASAPSTGYTSRTPGDVLKLALARNCAKSGVQSPDDSALWRAVLTKTLRDW